MAQHAVERGVGEGQILGAPHSERHTRADDPSARVARLRRAQVHTDESRAGGAAAQELEQEPIAEGEIEDGRRSAALGYGGEQIV